MVSSSGGASPLSVILMLRGALCADTLRIVSDPWAMCSGSVGADLRGEGALEDGEGSEIAIPGGPEASEGGPDSWEGLRESMVGMGVGLGAGRV
jgi:hypothetical protein